MVLYNVSLQYTLVLQKMNNSIVFLVGKTNCDSLGVIKIKIVLW